jgi:hypothetical protein
MNWNNQSGNNNFAYSSNYRDRDNNYNDRGNNYNDRGNNYNDRGNNYNDRGNNYNDRDSNYNDNNSNYNSNNNYNNSNNGNNYNNSGNSGNNNNQYYGEQLFVPKSSHKEKNDDDSLISKLITDISDSISDLDATDTDGMIYIDKLRIKRGNNNKKSNNRYDNRDDRDDYYSNRRNRDKNSDNNGKKNSFLLDVIAIIVTFFILHNDYTRKYIRFGTTQGSESATKTFDTLFNCMIFIIIFIAFKATVSNISDS